MTVTDEIMTAGTNATQDEVNTAASAMGSRPEIESNGETATETASTTFLLLAEIPTGSVGTPLSVVTRCHLPLRPEISLMGVIRTTMVMRGRRERRERTHQWKMQWTTMRRPCVQ